MPNLTTSIPSRKLPEHYSVVEFGVGSHPFAPTPTIIADLRGNMNPAWSFYGSRSYVACDGAIVPPYHEYEGRPEQIRQKAARRFAEYAERIAAERPGENIRFALCRAEDLDVEPNTADEIIISNVLSSNIDEQARNSLVARAATLLASGGLLVVRETFTPDLHPPTELIRRLGQFGFKSPEIVHPVDNAFEPLTAYYGETIHDIAIPSAGIRPGRDRYFGIAVSP